jgi:hypothetical protein
MRDGGVDDRAREFGIRVETLADRTEGLFNVPEGGVVAACGGVEGCGVGPFEGVDCDGWFGSLWWGGGGVAASLDREGKCLLD